MKAYLVVLLLYGLTAFMPLMGHGGEMWVESEEKAFTEFVITLPSLLL